MLPCLVFGLRLQLPRLLHANDNLTAFSLSEVSTKYLLRKHPARSQVGVAQLRDERLPVPGRGWAALGHALPVGKVSGGRRAGRPDALGQDQLVGFLLYSPRLWHKALGGTSLAPRHRSCRV